MNLDPAANHTGVLLESGSEVAGAEPKSAELGAAEIVREFPGIKPGRAHEMEGPGGAATFGEIGAFDQTTARIDNRGVDRGHVGRRQNPGEPGVLEVHGAPITLHRHHFEIERETEFIREHECEFAHRHPVPHRQRVHAHEREKTRIEDVALHAHPIDGVGTIENDEPHPVLRAGLHGMKHGVDERVVAGAHVLHVEDQGIEALQHLRGGHTRLAVETPHPKTRLRVLLISHFLEVLSVREHAMFRTEEGSELRALERLQMKGGVGEIGGDRGGVRDQAHPRAAQAGRSGKEFFESGAYALHGDLLSGETS